MAKSVKPEVYCLILVKLPNLEGNPRYKFFCRAIPARLFDPADINLPEGSEVLDVGDVKFSELTTDTITVKNGASIIAYVTSDRPPNSWMHPDTSLYLTVDRRAPVSMRVIEQYAKVDFSEILKTFKGGKWFKYRIDKWLK